MELFKLNQTKNFTVLYYNICTKIIWPLLEVICYFYLKIKPRTILMLGLRNFIYKCFKVWNFLSFVMLFIVSSVNKNGGVTKSPGSDRLNPGFYQAYWDILGCDLAHLCNFVLSSG